LLTRIVQRRGHERPGGGESVIEGDVQPSNVGGE